ncbi:MAG: DNA-directed RNA polymerase subunit beta' [Armatimonadetes bacterium]|nr:DNA-directed RNA polymerase subunit beta' [Armatimonadota bacterium]MDE2205204.1 DNA-directed RNA polymerase subunit beta' [Armatimonadota bacterium]
MADASTFSKIRIGIASPKEIEEWSKGEVKKPETINYRTYKPERDGLFCERIFGPVKDWECHCGRYRKVKYKGVVCERCGVEVTRSKVRRERMGHILLAAPVCHIWYLKGVPSPLALLLDISPRLLEKVLYFASYIVTRVDRPMIAANQPEIQAAVAAEVESLTREAESIPALLEEEFARELELHKAPEHISEYSTEELNIWDEDTIKQKRAYLAERINQEQQELEGRIIDLTDPTEGSVVLLNKLEKRALISEDQFRSLERLIEVLTQRTGDDWTQAVHAGLGGTAVKELLAEVDLERLSRTLREEIANVQGPRRVRAIKRLEMSEAFIASKAQPQWMVMDCVPVISPELRPMVQLDGGRFATSDLNDLYRRIINRNNRLKKITEIRAPESIVNHEKRLLQEAVDALIDNGRRQRPVVGSNNRALKSLSDMLKGKEGRFRKNLLGKRVDYSGRSVIVVGPHLKLHQCGLPKEMALELFKPFVMKTLVLRGFTSNIKAAKRMIEKMLPEVWDALEHVIGEHPVLLNRAPTLHRLGIQAFEPVLVDGKAIQVHPLVCKAFNADFDGDQMAVHVPLSAYAQAEARVLMLSSHNLFSPANGGPIVAPDKDIILGSYYITMMRVPTDPTPSRQRLFGTPEEAMLAYETGAITLHEPIIVRIATAPDGAAGGRERRTVGTLGPNGLPDPATCTTAGRLLFNQILPLRLRYRDRSLFTTINKKEIGEVVTAVYEAEGKECCVNFLDDLKALGFKYATKAGITISMTDMDVPAESRDSIIQTAQTEVNQINRSYNRGSLSSAERKSKILEKWLKASDDVGKSIQAQFEANNPLYIITDSGARGSWKQFTQLSGMRGLMTDPFGNLIEDLPIKSNFHEGLNVLEFFISTHGARKGMADTALRTADAGYLTRRLVDVAQDVIVRDVDCYTTSGVNLAEILEGTEVLEELGDRLKGRCPTHDVINPITGELMCPADEMMPDSTARLLNDIRIIAQDLVPVEAADTQSGYDTVDPRTGELIGRHDYARANIVAREGQNTTVAGAEAILLEDVRVLHTTDRIRPADKITEITRSLGVWVRSVLTCELRQGVCARCYGRDLATGRLVDIGIATGIIAAQSIGEPGTQLTMRTFHTGGVAGKHLTGVANVKEKRQSTLRELHQDIRLGVVSLEETSAARGGRSARPGDLPSSLRGMRAESETDSLEQRRHDRERSRSIQAFLKVLEDQVHGLLRVQELFEARRPKGQAIITEVGGLVERIETAGLRRVVVRTRQDLNENLPHCGLGTDAVSAEEILDETGNTLLRPDQQITDKELRKILQMGIRSLALYKVSLVPYRGNLEVTEGQTVLPGDRLTEGPLDPHKVLELQGPRGVQDYLVREIQSVYKSQGVEINDKHVEVIVRQMLRKRKVRNPGDSRFLPGQYVDKFVFEDENTRTVNADGQPATADWVLLGITDASLATESFLSAASFQKTTRVLTEAAVRGKKDDLVGLKENVIIGRLIPAGTGLPSYRSLELATADGTPLIVAPVRRDDRQLRIGSDDEMIMAERQRQELLSAVPEDLEGMAIITLGPSSTSMDDDDDYVEAPRRELDTDVLDMDDVAFGDGDDLDADLSEVPDIDPME